MFRPEELPRLQEAIRSCTERDKGLLEELCQEIRQLRAEVRLIKPRTSTAVSLVASDGGNNQLVFDPFFVQLIRVVDSYGKQLLLEAVTPTSDTNELSSGQFAPDGTPISALGRLLHDLGASRLCELSPMIPDPDKVRDNPTQTSSSWVLVYRDLCEWAVLYDLICHRGFATDTLLVRDGLLRTKIIRGPLFTHLRTLVENAINRIYREDHRRVFLVGIAKHSKVLTRYQLAMTVEGLFPPGDAYYVRVPREMERKAIVWPEWTRGPETEGSEGFVAGDMYFTRFGVRQGDPVWTVDVLSSQTKFAPEIFGYLEADAKNGFPVPFYPLCLQRAHQHAQVVDLDLHILQQAVYRSVLQLVPSDRRDFVEASRFTSDPAANRYR